MPPIIKNSPAFITGASGFIGGKLAERLLSEGRQVRVLSRRVLPELEKLGAEVMLGDLDNIDALRRGCAGAETVFHVAGRVGVWGPAKEFFKINVEGTRNIITACRDTGVSRLVYTSSPSVVYNGGNLAGVNESAPLCTKAPCAYPVSKAAAEREVSQAHSATFATISLRPHLVWGPGDKNLVPRVLTLARQGRLRLIGSGHNKVDLTHITNVVDAHLLAEQTLINGGGVPSPRVVADEGVRPPSYPTGGKAYFITNGEPQFLWDWINQLLREIGIPEVKKHISPSLAYAVGSTLEALWRMLPLKGEPPLTRFAAHEMATDHWFDISAARRDLGYQPRVTMAAGTAELIEHYRAGNKF